MHVCLNMETWARTWACGQKTVANNKNHITADKHMEIAGCEIDFGLWN